MFVRCVCAWLGISHDGKGRRCTRICTRMTKFWSVSPRSLSDKSYQLIEKQITDSISVAASKIVPRSLIRSADRNVRAFRQGKRVIQSSDLKTVDLCAAHGPPVVINPGHCGAEIGMKRRGVCQVFVKRRLIADREPRSQTPLGSK